MVVPADPPAPVPHRRRDWTLGPQSDRRLHPGRLASAGADARRRRPTAATLIRRVTFDLIGLPPTPEEVDAFVADPTPDAYEKLVDRLLASPRLRRALGAALARRGPLRREHGFETNTPRPNAWPYRDYVIRAFNEDMPYDRFVREQLAGDAARRATRRPASSSAGRATR